MGAAHHTYMLASKRRGALFIGTTADLVDCVLEHKANLVDGVTSLYAIHLLVYFERFDSAGPALLREAKLKQLPRCLKLRLIERQNPNWDDLFEFLAGVDRASA